MILIYIVPVAILADFGFNPGDPAWGFWLNLVAIAFAIIGPPSLLPLAIHFFRKPRKQLSYDTESDAALVDRQKDLGDDMEILFRGGVLQHPTPINDARLIMFKIINTGAEVIHKQDFLLNEKAKLRFKFAEAKLILCSVHHTEPDYLIPVEDRKSVIHLDSPTRGTPSPSTTIILPGGRQYISPHAPTFHQHVDLDGRTLQKGHAIVLKFVTQGRVKMDLQGDLLGGTIVPYVPSPPIFTVPRILVGLLLAILLVSSIFVSGVFRQNNCVLSFSPVTIGGSTAFYNTLQAQAHAYQRGCPFATLNVHSNDSAAGLLQLEQKNLDIAASEISLQEAGYNYHDLTEHQVAEIVFTMIINKDVVGVTSLSQEQITGIYSGRYTNWDQIPGLHGPHLPIVSFGRPSGSGTQEAFAHHVLQKPATSQTTLSSTQEMIDRIGTTKGAIGYADLGSANQASNIIKAISINGNAPTPGLVENGEYSFWAIERMYTRNDANNPLVSTFIAYITNNIQTDPTFIKMKS